MVNGRCDRCRRLAHFPRILFAFASILARAEELSLPFFTICVARALAFAAWLLSGIGYLREPGRPKVDFESLLRRVVDSLPCEASDRVAALKPDSLAMRVLPGNWISEHCGSWLHRLNQICEVASDALGVHQRGEFVYVHVGVAEDFA